MFKFYYYTWRLIATGMAFILFGGGGLFLTITIFPVIALAISDERKRREKVQGLIHSSFRLFVRGLMVFGLIDLNVAGKERLLRCKGQLIVSNHPTLLDVVLLISLTPKAQCIVKHQLWDHWFLGGVIRSAGYIRNDGDAEKLIEECSSILGLGGNIIFFPEGTRTHPGKSLKLKRGFAHVAIFSESNIQLVAITCRPTTLTKGDKWYEISKEKVKFDIFIDECLDISPYLEKKSQEKVVRKLTRDLEEYFNRKINYA
jgi:1-acyl-sn-glycerol-3-phosphate acyltransferase